MKTALFIVIALVSTFLFSCSHSHDHGDHVEAFGLVLFDSNNMEVLRVQNGNPSDSIRVKVDSVSKVYTVKFLDEKNELFTPSDDEISMKLTLGNGAIASETISNKWNFTVKGLSVGTTSLRVSLFHDDHADFVSAPIYIAVR